LIMVRFLIFLVVIAGIFVPCGYGVDSSFVKDAIDRFRARDYAGAVPLFEKVIKESPEMREAAYYLGISLARLNRKDEAIPYLKAYLKEYDEKSPWFSYDAFVTLSNILREKSEWDTLIDAGLSYLSIEKADDKKRFAKDIIGSAYLRLAENNFSRAAYKEAYANFLKALEYRPQDFMIWERVGRCLWNLGDMKGARSAYLRVLAEKSISWYTRLSIISLVPATTSGLDELEKVAEQIKDSEISSTMIRAWCMACRKQGAQALILLQGVEEKLGAKRGELVYSFAQTMVNKSETIPDFLVSIIGAYPDNGLVLWAAEMVLRFIGDRKNGLEECERVRRNFKETIEKVLPAYPGSTQAQQLFFRLIEARFPPGPDTPDVIRQKAEMCAAYLKEHPDADTTIVIEGMGREAAWRARLEEYERAVTLYENLVYKFNQRRFLSNLASAYAGAGDLIRAIQTQKDYLAGRPGDLSAQVQLAQWELDAGMTDEAVALLKELEPKAQGDWLRGRIAGMLKDLIRAIPESYSVPENGKISLFIVHTERQYSYTNYVNLDSTTPLISQKTQSVCLFPFSSHRVPLNILIWASTTHKGALAAPYAFIEKDGKNWFVKWEAQFVAVPDVWRKQNSFGWIFPWQDSRTNQISVKRMCTVDEGKGISIAELDIAVPDSEWTIEISLSPRAGKIETITPEPARRDGARTFIYSGNPAGHLNVRVEVSSFPPQWTFYYPKVVITKRTEKTIESIGSESGCRFSTKEGDFVITPQDKATTSILRGVEEMVYEVDEKIDQ